MLGKNCMIRKDILQKIKDCVDSKILNLANMQITDNEIPEIMDYTLKLQPNITIINLKNNRLGDAGAIELSNVLLDNKHIIQLNVEFNTIDEEGFKALSILGCKNSSFQLFFHGNKVTNAMRIEEIRRGVC